MRMHQLTGRFPGFSDVPVLFDSILTLDVLDRSVVALPPNDLKVTNDGKIAMVTQDPYLGTSINTKSGIATAGLSDPNKRRSTLSEIAPGGFSWLVLATDRDVRREIRTKLRSSLNVSVNL